jgi:hypothetical protein
MRLSRDTWLMILLLVILLAIMTVAGIGKGNQIPPLVSTSSTPDGAKALKLWLPDLGFRVNEDLVAEFAPPPGTDLVLMLQPQDFLDTDWKPLDAWVKSGGTLILAANGDWMAILADHFGFTASNGLNNAAPLYPFSPLFDLPQSADPVNANTATLLGSERDDYVVLLANQDGLISVTFADGKGTVVLCSAPYIFTNIGLKNDANAAFVLDLLSLAKPGSTVWFDEWHHGYRARAADQQIMGPGEWLRKAPIGNAILFIVFAVLLGLLLQGRAFGRPVPLPREIKRRTVMEHVTAVANLNRRAGHRADVLSQYRAQVKRQLGRRYRIDPALPDAEYAAVLKKFNPSLDEAKLLNLLRGLTRSDVSEADMVRLAAEAAEWIKE